MASKIDSKTRAMLREVDPEMLRQVMARERALVEIQSVVESGQAEIDLFIGGLVGLPSDDLEGWMDSLQGNLRNNLSEIARAAKSAREYRGD